MKNVFKIWLALQSFQAFAQFTFPLHEKVFLTGNYGEVRPNHFHAGIDFKTHPSNHLPIYAAADGYVSRIKVGTYGYGKVLYVTHPNGLVSVYGHEYMFNNSIKKYVEFAQKVAETFEIELFPKPNELPVKQGEIIGYTGNTGNTEGPHLHFEIRNEKTEAPLNPLRFLKVEDVIAPTIQNIALYDNDGKLLKISSPFKKTDTLTMSHPVGFGLNCFDYEQAGGNKNNIYKAEIFVDSKLVYKHVLDSIPFDVSKYVNTYADYDAKKQKHITIQKLFKQKNNELPIYKTIANNGFVYFSDGLYHTINIKVYDFYNHTDEVVFVLKTVPYSPKITKESNLYNCLESYQETKANYKINLPEKTLYDDVQLTTSFENNTLNFSGNKYDIPFQNNGTISIKTPESLVKYVNKLCIVSITNNVKSYVGGTHENNFVTTPIKNFGKYKIDVDTVAPQIKLGTKKKAGQYYKPGDVFYFKVSDAFSGIGSFKLYVNGKWYPSEYEHKNNTIFFIVNESFPKEKVLVNLMVQDKKNNQATCQTTLLCK